MADAQVKDSDRLSFTIFLALVAHAVVVLGITFAPLDPQPASQTMDVTLAQFSSDERPDDADFMADADQLGSGDQEEAAPVTATEVADIPAPDVREVEPLPREVAMPETTEQAPSDPVVETAAASAEAVPRTDEESREPEAEAERAPSLMDRSREIASLEAQLSDQRNTYAKRPRVTAITAASTLRSHDAWYVQNWQRRIEQVGNQYYPEEARRQGIHGRVRMLVAINQDGTVREITVLQSSGHSVLDDAAVRTVRQASPFAPFTDEMKAEQDVLEIIRTWSFQRRGLTAG